MPMLDMLNEQIANIGTSQRTFQTNMEGRIEYCVNQVKEFSKQTARATAVSPPVLPPHAATPYTKMVDPFIGCNFGLHEDAHYGDSYDEQHGIRNVLAVPHVHPDSFIV